MKGENKALIGLAAIGVGLTAAILALEISKQPAPGVFTARPRPSLPQPITPTEQPSFNSWSRQRRDAPYLVGGLQGNSDQASARGPSQISPLAYKATLLGGAGGTVTRVGAPIGSAFGPKTGDIPGEGVIFFTHQALPRFRYESDKPIPIF